MLLRLVKSDAILSDFAQGCLMSFLFIFRVPSETLQLRRAYWNRRVSEFSPHAAKAVVGIRPVEGTDYLALKMSYRENPTAGVIPKRPRFCGMDNTLARLACPVRSLWPGEGSSGIEACCGCKQAQL